MRDTVTRMRTVAKRTGVFRSRTRTSGATPLTTWRTLAARCRAQPLAGGGRGREAVAACRRGSGFPRAAGRRSKRAWEGLAICRSSEEVCHRCCPCPCRCHSQSRHRLRSDQRRRRSLCRYSRRHLRVPKRAADSATGHRRSEEDDRRSKRRSLATVARNRHTVTAVKVTVAHIKMNTAGLIQWCKRPTSADGRVMQSTPMLPTVIMIKFKGIKKIMVVRPIRRMRR